MSEYGYRVRPNMPDPFVTGGVDEPRNTWPRKIKSGLGGEGGYQRQLLHVVNSSNVDIIGSGLVFTDATNAGVLVNTANGWDATWKRTGRLMDLTGNSAVNMGSNRAYSRWELSPIPMSAANYTVAPYIIRIGSVIAARSTTMPVGGSAGAAFGLTNYSLTPTVIPTNAAVEFAAAWNAPDTYSTWSTWVANTGGTFTRSSATGISTNEPHLLEIEFDGVEHLINWYVDGVVVDQYAPNSADLFTHLTYGSNIEFLVNASNTTVTRMMYLADTVPLVSVLLADLDD